MNLRRIAKKLIVRPFQRFIQLESSSGIILALGAVLAMVWANTNLIYPYKNFWDLALFSKELIGSRFPNTLHFWINDVLMVLFFLIVGMEVKREILLGELSSVKKASLPIVAAIGGVILPGIIYTIFNPSNSSGHSGWAIPSATDIAFALGITKLLGDRVSNGLKTFLAALAIVDDLIAILIIALFYTDTLNWFWGVAALFITGILFLLNRMKIKSLAAYLFVGSILWFSVLSFGIHSTLAGVILAFMIPVYSDIVEDSPSAKLENTLHPWTSYGIIPLFALANAGVKISLEGIGGFLFHPVSQGVIYGLLFGKSIGIFTFSWIAIKLRFASLPDETTWWQMIGISFLGGIGFTMSFFIADLAFSDNSLLTASKIGILLGSIISGLVGILILVGSKMNYSSNKLKSL